MINSAVGKDLWMEISHLEIKDNVAEDDSTMVNYAISMEVFDKLLKHQDTIVDKKRQTKSSGRSGGSHRD